MAVVRKITVSAGRTFNHPFESYSNLKPFVTVEADLQEGEDFKEVTKELQAQAEQLVEDHKQNMLKSLRDLHTIGEKQRRIASLESSIQRNQVELKEERIELAKFGLPDYSKDLSTDLDDTLSEDGDEDESELGF